MFSKVLSQENISFRAALKPMSACHCDQWDLNMLKFKNNLKYMNGFQSVPKCFPEPLFGSGKFYAELLKKYFSSI